MCCRSDVYVALLLFFLSTHAAPTRVESTTWLPDSTWGDSFVTTVSDVSDDTEVAMSQALDNSSSSGQHDVDVMFDRIQANGNVLDSLDLHGLENDTSWMAVNTSAVSMSQSSVSSIPLPYTPGRWGRYSKRVLGRSLSGSPHVLWCGYFSPATAPAIRFGEQPKAPPDCSPSNADIQSVNDDKYWARTVDLPINRFWAASPADIFTWSRLNPDPIKYRSCGGKKYVPALESGMDFRAHWITNAAISPYWREWLEARGIDGNRMYQADMCVSLWVSRGVEITLKITDICDDCKPNQLRVEPYIFNHYVAGKPRLLWTFTKCWGHSMHPLGWKGAKTPGTALNAYNFPPLRSCFYWVKSAYKAQTSNNMKNDAWYRAAAPVPLTLRPSWQSVFDQVPSTFPRNPDGSLALT